MSRRDFIASFRGAVASVVLPVAAHAQSVERMRRVGILMSTVATDPEEALSVASFVAALGKAGRVTDRNILLIARAYEVIE